MASNALRYGIGIKDLLTLLERRDFISQSNVERLENVLRDADIPALANMVKEYMERFKSNSELLNGMAYFIILQNMFLFSI